MARKVIITVPSAATPDAYSPMILTMMSDIILTVTAIAIKFPVMRSTLTLPAEQITGQKVLA